MYSYKKKRHQFGGNFLILSSHSQVQMITTVFQICVNFMHAFSFLIIKYSIFSITKSLKTK